MLNHAEFFQLQNQNLSHLARTLYIFYLRPAYQKGHVVIDLHTLASQLVSYSPNLPIQPNAEMVSAALNELEELKLISFIGTAEQIASEPPRVDFTQQLNEAYAVDAYLRSINHPSVANSKSFAERYQQQAESSEPNLLPKIDGTEPNTQPTKNNKDLPQSSIQDNTDFSQTSTKTSSKSYLSYAQQDLSQSNKISGASSVSKMPQNPSPTIQSQQGPQFSQAQQFAFNHGSQAQQGQLISALQQSQSQLQLQAQNQIQSEQQSQAKNQSQQQTQALSLSQNQSQALSLSQNQSQALSLSQNQSQALTQNQPTTQNTQAYTQVLSTAKPQQALNYQAHMLQNSSAVQSTEYKHTPDFVPAPNQQQSQASAPAQHNAQALLQTYGNNQFASNIQPQINTVATAQAPSQGFVATATPNTQPYVPHNQTKQFYQHDIASSNATQAKGNLIQSYDEIVNYNKNQQYPKYKKYHTYQNPDFEDGQLIKPFVPHDQQNAEALQHEQISAHTNAQALNPQLVPNSTYALNNQPHQAFMPTNQAYLQQNPAYVPHTANAQAFSLPNVENHSHISTNFNQQNHEPNLQPTPNLQDAPSSLPNFAQQVPTQANSFHQAPISNQTPVYNQAYTAYQASATTSNQAAIQDEVFQQQGLSLNDHGQRPVVAPMSMTHAPYSPNSNGAPAYNLAQEQAQPMSQDYAKMQGQGLINQAQVSGQVLAGQAQNPSFATQSPFASTTTASHLEQGVTNSAYNASGNAFPPNKTFYQDKKEPHAHITIASIKLEPDATKSQSSIWEGHKFKNAHTEPSTSDAQQVALAKSQLTTKLHKEDMLASTEQLISKASTTSQKQPQVTKQTTDAFSQITTDAMSLQAATDAMSLQAATDAISLQATNDSSRPVSDISSEQTYEQHISTHTKNLQSQSAYAVENGKTQDEFDPWRWHCAIFSLPIFNHQLIEQPRRPFRMYDGWEPSPSFPYAAHQAGIINYEYSQRDLKEFIAYWLTRPEKKTQRSWELSFIQRLISLNIMTDTKERSIHVANYKKAHKHMYQTRRSVRTGVKEYAFQPELAVQGRINQASDPEIFKTADNMQPSTASAKLDDTKDIIPGYTLEQKVDPFANGGFITAPAPQSEELSMDSEVLFDHLCHLSVHDMEHLLNQLARKRKFAKLFVVDEAPPQVNNSQIIELTSLSALSKFNDLQNTSKANQDTLVNAQNALLNGESTNISDQDAFIKAQAIPNFELSDNLAIHGKALAKKPSKTSIPEYVPLDREKLKPYIE